MKLKMDSTVPIYIQIAEIIEDQILEHIIEEGEKVYSTNELSALLKVNPATARKGLNLLVDEGIIYKERGVGMFVKEGAADKIKSKRTDKFFKEYIIKMIQEAEKLGIKKEDIIEMVKSYSGEVVNNG